nr:MAG TPA: hypothetical protein [Bacteriophage sp.]
MFTSIVPPFIVTNIRIINLLLSRIKLSVSTFPIFRF